MVWAPKDPPPAPPPPKFAIPRISDAELKRRGQLIRPVFHQGKTLFYQKVKSLDANLASPEAAEEAIGLRRIKAIRTLHKIQGYHQFLTYTTAEMLAQIPEDLLDRVVAFELHGRGPSTAEDLNRERETTRAGFFVFEPMLYSLDKEAVRKEELRPKTPLAKALLGDDDPFKDVGSV